MFLESQNFVQSLTPKIFWCTETGIEVSLIGKAKSHFEGPMARAYTSCLGLLLFRLNQSAQQLKVSVETNSNNASSCLLDWFNKELKVWVFVYLCVYILEWGSKPDWIGCIRLDWWEFKANCQSNPIHAIQSRFCTQPLIGVVGHRLNSKQDGLTIQKVDTHIIDNMSTKQAAAVCSDVILLVIIPL